MKYYYTIYALREMSETTDMEISASFIHQRGDLTDTGAMRIAMRRELLSLGDRLERIECICYDV